MSNESKGEIVSNLPRYLFYLLLLVFWLMIQTKLKEMPQVAVLLLAIAIVSMNLLKSLTLFRIFHFVLLMILAYSFVFQSVYLLWDLINPNRGWIEVDGEVVRAMDMSAILVVPLSFIAALILAAVNFNKNRNKSVEPEYHLSIATLVASSIVFAYFELLS